MWPGGRKVAVWVAGGIEIKAISVQFQLKLPVVTELGKMFNCYFCIFSMVAFPLTLSHTQTIVI